jgi:hypothetical protein
LERELSSRLAPFDAVRQLTFWQKVAHGLYQIPLPSVTLVFHVGRAFIATGVLWLALGLSQSMNEGWEAVGLTLSSLWAALNCLVLAGTIRSLESSAPVTVGYSRKQTPVTGPRLLRILPVCPERAFNSMKSHVIWLSLWLVVECAGAYALLPGFMPGNWMSWAQAIVCAGIQWGVVWAAALLLVRWRMNWEKMLPVLIVISFALTMIIVIPRESAMQKHLAYGVCLLFPTGWGNLMYDASCVHGQAWALWLLIPNAVLLITLPRSVARVRSLYDHGALCRTGSVVYTGFMPRDETTTVATDVQKPLAGALDPPDWHRTGWMGRLIMRALSPSERQYAGASGLWRIRSTRHYGLILAGSFVYAILTQILLYAFLSNMLAIGSHSLSNSKGDSGIILFIVLFFCSIAVVCIMAFNAGMLVFCSSGVGQVFGSHLRGSLIFPATCWMESRVAFKTSCLWGLALVPVCLFLDQMPGPADFDFGRIYHPQWFYTKCLLMFWGVRQLLSALSLCGHHYVFSRAFWKEAAGMVLAVCLAICAGGMLFCATDLWKEFALAAGFILAMSGWLFFCGARYLECSFGNTVKSVFHC